MIKVELDSSKEGVNIFIDHEGVDELIGYLNFIRDNNDHFHLLAGNELSEDDSVEPGSTHIKHLRIGYIREW